jgi:hypothetical protein
MDRAAGFLRVRALPDLSSMGGSSVLWKAQF